MSKTLVIELPDDLHQQLLAVAQQQQIPLEKLAIASLTQLISQSADSEFDPILPLLGTLSAEVTDISEHHDSYIGRQIQQESDLAQ